jgi:hypothetical protein
MVVSRSATIWLIDALMTLLWSAVADCAVAGTGER